MQIAATLIVLSCKMIGPYPVECKPTERKIFSVRDECLKAAMDVNAESPAFKKAKDEETNYDKMPVMKAFSYCEAKSKK